MTTFLSILATFIEFICFYIAGKSILQQTLRPTQTDCLFCLLYLLVIGCFSNASPSYLLLAGQFLLLIYFIVNTKPRILNSILLYVLIFSIITCTQMLLVTILGMIQRPLSGTFSDIIGNSLTLGLLFLFCRIFPLHKLYQWMIQSSLICRIILLNSYFIALLLVFFNKIDMPGFYQSSMISLLIVTLFLSANLCILYYDQQMQMQQQQLEFYEKNQTIYADLIQDIRASQHEYSNRLQHLEHLPLVCKDYTSLCTALGNYTRQYKKPIQAYPLLRINMPLLAASLYSLYTKAEAKQITIQFDVVSEILHSSVPEHELTDYLCILTQNAIEACKPGDIIYVFLESDEQHVHFTIRNPSRVSYSPSEVSQFFRKGYTTKQNDTPDTKRGFGLYTLSRNVQKKHGMIFADCIEFHDIYWIIFQLIL